jgi:hypothetical protein
MASTTAEMVIDWLAENDGLSIIASSFAAKTTVVVNNMATMDMYLIFFMSGFRNLSSLKFIELD